MERLPKLAANYDEICAWFERFRSPGELHSDRIFQHGFLCKLYRIFTCTIQERKRGKIVGPAGFEPATKEL